MAVKKAENSEEVAAEGRFRTTSVDEVPSSVRGLDSFFVCGAGAGIFDVPR